MSRSILYTYIYRSNESKNVATMIIRLLMRAYISKHTNYSNARAYVNFWRCDGLCIFFSLSLSFLSDCRRKSCFSSRPIITAIIIFQRLYMRCSHSTMIYVYYIRLCVIWQTFFFLPVHYFYFYILFWHSVKKKILSICRLFPTTISSILHAVRPFIFFFRQHDNISFTKERERDSSIYNIQHPRPTSLVSLEKPQNPQLLTDDG